MKKSLKIIIKSVLVLFVVFTIPNYYSFIYKFKTPQKFNGDHFYNPYENLEGNWIKANLHAHTKAFLGLADGENTAEEMLSKYDSLKYDLACISNYNFIQDSVPGYNYLPVYEHGFNPKWVHQLVVNESNARWFDFPLIQLKSNKQFIMNRLKTKDNLIVLNHSNYKSAYSASDLKCLDNYDLIEGISEFANSIYQWDYALSHGHAAWIVGNDDAHDLSDYHIGICWNMVLVDSLTKELVVNSLKRGASYATKGWMGQEMNRLQSISVEGDLYRLRMQRNADSIILKSDFGKQVAYAVNTDTVVYTIQPEDSYVRAEVFETETWNTYTKMYFNPVIRTTEEGLLPDDGSMHEVSYVRSVLYWIGLFLIHAIMLGIVWKW